ncbi:VOC family protein [Paraflavitalea sp. CAU 1676]|uniref:VOC family protein n=1 Tax=Paraflavitalea sp. CAU 1676 TaxID=3032598 RepID=UPI0023D9B098|nr:VOC family protein [Paraflavitalea sp. CAU 1676]MDF2193480.1 VOC family protein [Paraflavitalea sp. CAU 1676]
MKQFTITTLITAASFCLGFAAKTFLTPDNAAAPQKVTGIGGVFFKCKDPKKVNEWYQQHLGLKTNAYGATFDWYEGFDSTRKGQTQWTTFKETSKYFEPSTKDFMINYRVANLVALVADLKKEGVTIVDTIATYDFGKFVHIMDLEGNKVQLWEPIDN